MRELMNELEAVERAERSREHGPEEVKIQRRRRGQRMSIRDTLRKIWQAAVPFFTDKASRCRAWAVALSILLLIMIQTRMYVWGTDIGVDLDNSIQGQDRKLFHRQLLFMIGWIVLSLPVSMILRYLQGCFAYEWRRFITLRMLEDYIGPNQAYYQMKFQFCGIDNPDQRIGQDVGGFTDNSVNLIIALLKGAFTTINSAAALYHVSNELLAFVVIFSTFITFVQFGAFGSRLMFWQRVALAQEADLRFGLVRVREHAESIAFYHGEDVERGNNAGFFSDVLVTLYRKLRVIVFSHGTDDAAGGVANLLPYAIVAPKFFAGEISFGRIYQSINLFSQVFGALDTTFQTWVPTLYVSSSSRKFWRP
jgi:putative ATP-binding cassette transporter